MDTQDEKDPLLDYIDDVIEYFNYTAKLVEDAEKYGVLNEAAKKSIIADMEEKMKEVRAIFITQGIK